MSPMSSDELLPHAPEARAGKPEVKPYQARVLTERADLSEKVEKLGRFLFDGTSAVLSLPVDEQARLLKQYSYMRIYLEVLDERIVAFDVAGSTSAATAARPSGEQKG